MKRTFFIAIVLLVPLKNFSQKDTLNAERIKRKWYIPSFATLQFAGNIGTLSAGVGYQIFHDYWQASILYGYVPPKKGVLSINTIAIKNAVCLYRFKLKKNVLAPYLGFTCNYETGNNSFTYLAPQYPKGYYLMTSVHFTFFGGIKDRISLGKHLFLEPYLETGTVDSYLFYFFHEYIYSKWFCILNTRPYWE